MKTYETKETPPPSFEEARNTRQKARAAGMNPNYWYGVELEANIQRGQAKEIVFWKQSIALFRGEDGEIRAVENRCAHRQLRLSTGQVSGCNLVCPYHGWTYDGDGRVVDIPHSLFGRDMPRFKVRSFAVKVRYGVVFLFPGDPERAEQVPLPEIPALEGPDRWACVPIVSTWQAHHSMILDNVSDFTHAWLHRKYKPFWDAEMTDWRVEGDRVFVEYDTKVGGGSIFRHFVPQDANNSHIELCYDYPYQWSNTDDKIRHWLFVTPIDERTTKSIFLFHFKRLKVPALPVTIPRQVMNPFLKIANRMLVGPLLGEDGFAVEEEQLGYEAHWDAPLAELNPVVKAFQELTIRKWEEHLEEQGRTALRKKGSTADAAAE